MSGRIRIACWILALCTSATLAAEPARWLHIVVDEGGQGAETVRVHLPLAAVERALPLIENEHLQRGRLRLSGRADLEGIDLRAVWAAVREADDGDFVTVDSADSKVRVSKTDGFMLVLVQEGGENGEQVEVRVPLAVVDALFSGPGDELDVMAALRVLKELGDGDLVRVRDGDSRVRIWIDANPSTR